MQHAAPGKAHREGITLITLMEMFPSEEAATRWLEAHVWPGGRCCGHCGSTRTQEASHRKMPYWCSDCRSYFSVRTGTALSHSRIPLRKWAIAIYLELTSLKSVSSIKLHRDIGVRQATAWFMLHRIRQAWASTDDGSPFTGPVEVDEAYMGGRRANMSNAKRKALAKAEVGRGAVGKTAIVGIKDRASNKVRAQVVESTDAATLRVSSARTPPLALRCTPMTQRPTGASHSRTRRSSTPSPSMSGTKPTPTAWSPSGPRSSVPTRASSTR